MVSSSHTITIVIVFIFILFINIEVKTKGNLFGYMPTLIVSGSMEPVIMTNSLVLVKAANFNDLAVNDIIMYRKGNLNIVHRVVDIDKGNKVLKTKGDSNDIEEQLVCL